MYSRVEKMCDSNFMMYFLSFGMNYVYPGLTFKIPIQTCKVYEIFKRN